jgi:Arc/MetJ-type ribon-helix-helix transcriptional regulator
MHQHKPEHLYTQLFLLKRIYPVRDLERKTVADLDRWVREGKYPNRSRALQSAVDVLTERDKHVRLARECSKLDPQDEKQLAEEGLVENWPEY